jgi:hypothetical protein
MEYEEKASPRLEDPNWVFFKRYFRSPVSHSALAFVLVAAVAAWASKTPDGWWRGYLQDLSTTCVGIASTVWAVSFWSEFKTFQLLKRINAPLERAMLRSVSRFIERAPLLLPTVQAPGDRQWYQFEWIQEMLEHVRAQCDSITLGTNDTDLEQATGTFRSEQDAWSIALQELQQLIDTKASSELRASAFSSLKDRTDKLLDSAKTLRYLLTIRQWPENSQLGAEP